LLARGPIEALENVVIKKRSNSESDVEEPHTKKLAVPPGLGKLMRRDFLVRRTGASAAALSLKRLQHEITLENLVLPFGENYSNLFSLLFISIVAYLRGPVSFLRNLKS